MKAKVLSFAIALIALFNFNSAFAQSPHFVQDPCVSSSLDAIVFKVAGLGNDAIIATFSGEVWCENPADKDDVPAWESKDITQRLKPIGTDENGNYVFALETCNNRWDLRGVQNGTLTIYDPSDRSTPLDSYTFSGTHLASDACKFIR
ncbi:hypothetical protein [Pontibacter ruber]|uniref:Uncharacterized protein n=1 Tax=Pontibacter ruber TaxID=1343895 RepID=A0ABW5CZ04_9BACT|nr:hypothetical protein [Pontibacter ruber]